MSRPACSTMRAARSMAASIQDASLLNTTSAAP
jgi:hypothetical protein